nr:M48 family metallopeptidase [Stenotrophomonas pavanii]
MKKIAKLACLMLATAAANASAAAPPANPEFIRWNQISAAVWPLSQANVELCGAAVAPSLGFSVGGSNENLPLLLGVGEGSPAQVAGLQDFDELVSINGEKLKTRKLEKVLDRYAEVLAKEAKGGQPLDLVYLRGGVESKASVTPVPACDFRVVYVPRPIPSTTQGATVLLGNAIDSYAHTPEQIRAYVSRSVARIILDHQGENARQGRGLNLLSSAAGVLTGHQPGVTGNALARFRNSERQDLEQDYLSVFLLARAGDDVSGITDFWQGVFSNMTGNQLLGRALGQSQGSPARLEELAAARDDVLAKKQAGEPLLPTGRNADKGT